MRDRYDSVGFAVRGSLPSRNTGQIQITVTAGADAGDVLDVESGHASPGQTAGRIQRRKASGYFRPTIYCSLATVPAVRQGTGAYILGRDYGIWMADWTGSPHEVTAPGLPRATCSVTQYENTANYDVSAVYDGGWPHRTAPGPAPRPAKPPELPSGIRATGVTATSVTLAWRGDPTATSCRIRVTYQGRLVKEEGVSAATATISGLDPDHTYTFHIAASNAAGMSAETNGPTVRTPR